jgi:hypothetical protein
MYLNIIAGNSGGVLLDESGKLIEITILVNSNYNKNNLFRGSMMKKRVALVAMIIMGFAMSFAVVGCGGDTQPVEFA